MLTGPPPATDHQPTTPRPPSPRRRSHDHDRNPAQAATLPQTSRARAEEVLLEQLAAYIADVQSLSPDEWSRPTTDCPDWDVRRIAAHLAGELDEAHISR